MTLHAIRVRMMPKIALCLLSLLAFLVMILGPTATIVHAAPAAGDPCTAARKYKFLGILPTWYEYIQDYKTIESDLPDKNSTGRNLSQVYTPSCGIVHPDTSDTADNVRKDAVAIGLAVIDILLRLGTLVAVAAVMLGGYKYISSQGEPKNIEAAMATIVNAAIGLAIVLASTVLVAFIGHSVGG